MPLYEYQCKECGHRFETYVRGSERPTCPACDSGKLEKQLSVFGMGASRGNASSRSVPGGASSCGTSGGG